MSTEPEYQTSEIIEWLTLKIEALEREQWQLSKRNDYVEANATQRLIEILRQWRKEELWKVQS
jgi:UDP-N-acetylglucosamine 2-epimerase